MKTITVQELADRFSLEVLAGCNHMHRTIGKSRTYRPGLEFVGYFDFFSRKSMCRCLGRKRLLTCINWIWMKGSSGSEIS